MSDSLAVLRKTQNHELAELAEQHLKHDLTDHDRDVLKSAASSVSTATMIGTLVGLSIAGYAAYRVRQRRLRMFEAFKHQDKPTHVRFANGREEPIPDITPLIRPSAFGSFAAYSLFAAGGLLLGGETGLLLGSYAAKKTISGDSESRARIERAFRSFRADVLRKQIDELEGKNGKKMFEL